jgi:sulfofructose kinase
MPAWDVLGFGVVAVDDLVYVEHYLAADSKAPVLEERRDGGGLAGTALVAAARLGATTAWAGNLGDDELSLFTLREFEREGVDCSLVRRVPGARPVHSTVVVDRSNGQRTIMYYNAGVVPPRLEDFAAAVPRCRVLFIDSTVPAFALDVTELAHRCGVPVVVDMERIADERTIRLAHEVDHLIVGVAMGERLTGKSDPAAMVQALRSPQQAACVVTVGPDGCWYATRESGGTILHRPAYRVQAVDTTGCGDVFHGAYAAGIARGDSVEQAIKVATATAGLKATRPGGRSGIPNRLTVEQFMQQQDTGAPYAP